MHDLGIQGAGGAQGPGLTRSDFTTGFLLRVRGAVEVVGRVCRGGWVFLGFLRNFIYVPEVSGRHHRISICMPL